MLPQSSQFLIKRNFNCCAKLFESFKWIKPSEGYATDIKLYNPVTKSKSQLILKNSNIATWYMCGPTVYASAHIGHASTYVRFDIIRRILSEFFDINVLLIMGLTDIDDKIIKRSNLYKENWLSLTHHYEVEFFKDMNSLNVLRPLTTCKVTKFVPQIIDFVQNILSRGAAYVTQDGSVYFDSTKCKNYGKLALPQETEMADPDKRSCLDFALWKASKEGEPWWDSPWGHGRPGWHIECSAIASTIFGKTIDIHSGGIDLAFPHHENEEAQSCCYHDVDQWVNYWLHTGHLNLFGDQKMSKSLNNTISIPSLLQNYTANEFRMFCLLTHYRKNVEFSEEVMSKSVVILKKIQFFLNDCRNYISGRYVQGSIDEPELLKCLDQTKLEFRNALSNDFNTPRAIKEIVKLVDLGNKMMRQKKKQEAESTGTTSIAAVLNFLEYATGCLGVSQSSEQIEMNQAEKIIDEFVEFRDGIRLKVLNKDINNLELLKACDHARSALSEFGLDIRDQQGKSTWMLRN